MKAYWTLLLRSIIIVISLCSIDGLIHKNSFALIRGLSRRRSQVLNMSSYKSIYGISQSGWKSPKWNWGSAIGTGHDCAKICRQNYATPKLRQELISNLLNAQGNNEDLPLDFEEVKLTMALAWQRGRWDGSDGGKGGYGEVLEHLVRAERYETGSELEWSERWIRDLACRFHLLQPPADHLWTMERMLNEITLSNKEDHGDRSAVFLTRRRCSGLVLHAMGFIENGC